jgi:hypothetical protein
MKSGLSKLYKALFEARNPEHFARFLHAAVKTCPARLAVRTFGVTYASVTRAHDVKQGILLAVHADIDEVEIIAACRTFDPKLVAARAPENGHTVLQRTFQRGTVRVGQSQNFARVGMLDRDRQNVPPRGGDFGQFCKIERFDKTFFKFTAHNETITKQDGSNKRGIKQNGLKRKRSHNRILIMQNYNAESGCCPRFSPEKYDGKEFVWKDKLFVKDHVCTFFHMPLNFGKVITRCWTKVEEAGALTPEPPLVLSDHTSLWNMDLYIEVTKDVPGVRMAKLSGTYFTKVFEGPYSKMGRWENMMKDWVTAKGKTVKHHLMSYVYCPKCAKFYGKNYVVFVTEVE